jgi:hypothetical protein
MSTKLPSWNKQQLSILPLYLTPGNYVVKFNARMTGTYDINPFCVSFIKQILFLLSQYARPLAGMARFELFPVQGVASTKMEVVPSPLEIKISSGGLARRVVAKDETIFLYAEDNSVDPDDPGKVG